MPQAPPQPPRLVRSNDDDDMTTTMKWRSKARVCGRSLAGIVGSNSAGGMDVVSAMCCQVVVSATDRSLVQKSRSECGESEYDLETSAMRTPRPARDTKKKYIYITVPCRTFFTELTPLYFFSVVPWQSADSVSFYLHSLNTLKLVRWVS
jgi:hypothetical protein